MLKDLFKGSIIYGIAPFVPKILSVLLLPILTKYLTSTDYGIIGTITSIVFAIQALQDLGLNVLLPNYFYKCKYHYKIAWREIYGFLSLWMILFACVQAILLYFFIPEEADANKWIIIGLSNFSTVFFGPTSLIGRMYYQLNLKPTPVAIRVVISGVITILANYVCVVVFRWGYLGAYVGSFAGSFIVNLSYWPVVNHRLGLSPIYKFKFKTIYGFLKVGIPTIPHYYASYLMNSSNIVAMNYYEKPQSEIGHLTMAQNMSHLLDTVSNAINQVFGPMTFKCIREKDSKGIKRLLFTYILMIFSLTFLFSLWSREVYAILISNEEIASKYKYAIILVMALNYRPLYVYCADYFFFFEHTVQLLGISFAAGIICCVVYFVGIPFIGIYAALIGFYVGCTYYGYIGYSFSFYKKVSIYKIKWYLLLFFQIVLTLVAFFFVDYSIVVKMLISLGYLILAGAFFYQKVLQRRLYFQSK